MGASGAMAPRLVVSSSSSFPSPVGEHVCAGRFRASATTKFPSALLLPAAANRGARHEHILARSFGLSSLQAATLANLCRLQEKQQLRFPGSRRRGSGPVPIRAARMEAKPVGHAFTAPGFELPEPLTGRTWKLDDFEDREGLLVMFICNHCPFVVHLKESLANFAREYQQKGLGVVAVSSNSSKTHPQDGPAFMAEDAKNYGYSFPYLYDETQEVAKAYGAVCTPEFFLFRKNAREPFLLVYHGRYDETRPRTNATPTGRELKAAADALLSDQRIPSLCDQKPSIGCSIKWH